MDIEFLLLLQNMREACGECFNKFADFIATIAVDCWVFVPVLAGAVVLCLFGCLFVRFKSYPIDIVDGKVLVGPAKMTINGFMTVYPLLAIKFEAWARAKRETKA